MAEQEVGNLKVKVSMDTTGFQEGVSGLNRQLKVVQSSFEESTSKIGKFGSNTDKLKIQADNLSKQLELQKQKVEALTNAYNKSVENKGADAKATQDLEIKLNKAKTALYNMQNQLSSTNKEIDVQGSKWTSLSKNLSPIGDKFKAVGEKMTSIGKSLTATVTAPIVGLGVASVKLASDVNESMNKVEVAFGNSSKKVESWANTTLKSYGIAKGTALDMSSTFGDMATSLGLSQDKASKMSMSLVGLAGDLSSFKNIGIEEATTALNGIFTGETESLKSLGIVMTQANLQQFAYSQGIKKNIQDMCQAEQVQLRYNYILSVTKNAQGDFARTSGGTANQMRIFQESLKEVGATIGQQLLPIITPLIAKVNNWIQTFGSLDDKTKKIILVVAGIAAVIPPIIIVIGTLVSSVGSIIVGFSTASAAIATAGGMIAVLTGPIGITIAIITGLIAVGVLLYKNWDTIKEKASELGNWIGNNFNAVKNSISNAWNSVKSSTSQVWESIKQKVQEHGGGIKGIIGTYAEGYASVWSFGFNKMNDLTGGKLGEIVSKVSNIGNTIKQKLKDMFNFDLPHIKLPHFSLKGSLSLVPPRVPSLDVNWYDTGGIFSSPTVIGVGERRTEFVGALDDLRYLIRDELNKSNTTKNTYNQPLVKMDITQNIDSKFDYDNGWDNIGRQMKHYLNVQGIKTALR